MAKCRFGLSEKYEITKSLASELTQQHPGLGGTIGFLSLYFAVLVLPLLIAIPAMILVGMTGLV